MIRYALSVPAREDLFAIRELIRETNGPVVAKRILSEMREKMDLLVQFPRIGRVRLDIVDDDTIFFFPFYSWFIIYLPDSSPLEIVRIVSARRDIADIFE